jgi:excinuclease ABC subunit B
VLITTLTNRMSEDLADYLTELNIRVRYLHSEIEALDRVDILRKLRLGDFDVLVGINLLREGLDLPEVSLVAILDADKQGFLRSTRSLMQTAGRAARNIGGTVILYADKKTEAIRSFVDETNRRREIQKAFNETHGITPATMYKTVDQILSSTSVADSKRAVYGEDDPHRSFDKMEKEELVSELEKEMEAAAVRLEFERAAELRDEIARIKEKNAKGKKSFGYRGRR